MDLTSIVSVFVKPQEHVADFQLLFCKLQQPGETAVERKTDTVTHCCFYIISILYNNADAPATDQR